MNYCCPDDRGLVVTIRKDESGAIVVVSVNDPEEDDE